MREILKLLGELKENYSCDKNTSDVDDNLNTINNVTNFGENTQKYTASLESISSDNELNEIFQTKCSGGSHETLIFRKIVAKKM